MNWIRRLFGLGNKQQPAISKDQAQRWSWQRQGITPFACDTNDFNVEIVGESNYQDELKGARRHSGADFVRVFLQRQPNNPYDSNAVAVHSALLQVIGYLPRHVAVQYAPILDEVEKVGLRATCRGRINGGRKDRPSLGIWLDLAEPKAIKQKLSARGSAGKAKRLTV